jgi:sugar/nucleoside kinase (ribokinase family)
MPLLVTGSIGVDTVETPAGRRDGVIGGSAVYFSYAASFFAPVRLVGVVGEDARRNCSVCSTSETLTPAASRCGRAARRSAGMAPTSRTSTRPRACKRTSTSSPERAPKIPDNFRDSRYVFLANTHPVLQQEMLCCLKEPKLIVADTMNLWINTARSDLVKLLGMIHGLVLNDGEARLLTEKKNLIEAARDVLKMGPKFVVIKKGEHGCLMVSERGTFVYPLTRRTRSSTPPAPATASPAA